MYSSITPKKANTSLKSQAISAALKGIYATPYVLNNIAAPDKLWVLTLNDVSPSSFFSGLPDYSAADLFNLHMSRAGEITDISTYNDSILVIYAMMREGVISVSSKKGEYATRFYTLNEDILMMLNPAECTESILDSVEEDCSTICPNSIHCIEIKPTFRGKYVNFSFYEAYYFLDVEDTFVTFAAVGKIHIDELIRKLLSRVYEIRYTQPNCYGTKKIVTTLSESILLDCTTKEIMEKVTNTMIDSSFLTLNLPSLEDEEVKHGVMESVFIPNILSVTPINDYIPQKVFKPFR